MCTTNRFYLRHNNKQPSLVAPTTTGRGTIRHSTDKADDGFALVIALSLMAFVLLLVISISTFTQLELRASQTIKNELTAQQNALLGLQVALGKLQKLSGPDQRITASAEIFDTDNTTEKIEGVMHPNWIGVWDAAPELSHLNDRIDTTNNYYRYPDRRDGSDNRFLGWLVSGGKSAVTDRDANITQSDEILIYGEGFDLEDAIQLANQIRVEKVTIQGDVTDNGSYAFWIGDENIKARIDAYEPQISSVADSDLARSRFMVNQRNAIEKINSPGDVLGSITGGTNEDAINALISPGDLGFILNDPDAVKISMQQNAHALTTSSYSLLTNTYASGLKVDLSALLRQSSLDSALNEGIPAFATADGNHAIAKYPSSTANHPAPPAATWEQLRSYAATTAEPAGSPITARKHTSSEHGYFPIVTRYVLNIVPVFESDTTNGDRLLFHLEPIIVLANPYNANLQLGNDMRVHLYFEKRDFANNRGIHIENNWIKRTDDDTLFVEQFLVDGTPSNLFENGDLIEYTDSRGVEYVGFTFRLPDITLAPGNVMSFGVANDGANYSGDNLLELGAFAGNTKSVILAHKDSDGNELRADPNWSNLIYSSSQGAMHINREGFPNIEVAPLAMAIGISDQPEPSTDRDFYHLAQGFESSNPNNQMRYGDGFDRGRSHARNTASGVSDLYDYNAMTRRAINFDVVMAAGFEYASNDLRGSLDAYAAGYRINARWLIGHNFRATKHSPVATDLTEKASNTLYGAIAGYAPWSQLGSREHHIPTVVMNADGNAYWGTGIGTDGLTTNTFFDLPSPSVGLLSLGQLQHMQISSISSSHLYGIGNGVADLKIGDTGNIYMSTGFENSVANAYLPIDQSYLINNALWDSFFFSGLRKDLDTTDLSTLKSVPLNNRYLFTDAATPEQLNAPSRTASALYVRGGFNINSTKKEAWKAVLAGANTLNIDPSGTGAAADLQSPVTRSIFPSRGSGNSNEERLNGYRELSDAELDSLAGKIVKEIKERGPFLSLSDFVNRRIETGNTNHGLFGTLEAALRASGINDRLTNPHGALSEFNEGDLPKQVSLPEGYLPEVFEGSYAEGISQWITQADLLQRIGPFISARSDTFTIRAYGEALDSTGRRVSRALCEAIVQRTYNYIDDTSNSPNQARIRFNNADENFEAGSLTALNEQFGRRYKIISFKWL
jgi:hypothetical protein